MFRAVECNFLGASGNRSTCSAVRLFGIGNLDLFADSPVTRQTSAANEGEIPRRGIKEMQARKSSAR